MLEKRNSAIRFLDDTAARFSGNVAIEDAGDTVTFSELQALSKSVGTWLLKNGYKNENIAILLPKKICAIVSFFGVLYSGNTYVPLDYNDAAERALKIIEKVDSPLVITDAKNATWLKESGKTTVIYEEINNDEVQDDLIYAALDEIYDLMPAYIMHTSGSTGEPKGVVISHRGLIDFTEWITDYFKLDEKSVIALQSPFHFDASIFDIYSCIGVGSKIVIMPDVFGRFPAKIPSFLEENHITCIFWVPGILADIANSGVLSEYKIPELKMFTFIGEVMPTKQLNIWIKENPDRCYINLYGPTEATVACSAYKIERPLADTDSIPIGKASLNKKLIILNEENKQTDTGEIGEICILGSGLALGYYGKKELSDNVFVQNPLNDKYEEMMYRTGDYGFVNKDGDIVFSGRRDSQVKVHGIRVELGDIENAACCVDGIERTCAVLDAEKKMVLFLQTKIQLSEREIKKLLKEHVPKYMVPDKVVMVESFPINKNGKIDRKELLKLIEK